MAYQLLADLTVLVHAVFVLFVVFGGLLCRHRLFWIGLHIPAVLWGVWIEWSGHICPLTPLENYFRQLAGEHGYTDGFIDHYLVPILYPTGLTRNLQWLLVAVIIFVNLAIYIWLLRQLRYRQPKS